MTWFKIDDSFYDHPKVFDLPDCAVALWVRAGCWSARSLKDGFVPASMPARLCDDPENAIRHLVDRGLWSRTRGGFQFHDWHDYQPSAAHVKDVREKRAAAGRRGGQAKATNQRAGKPVASASNLPDGLVGKSLPRPVPSRRDGDGSIDGHLQVADARANDGREIFINTYGLLPELADRAMEIIASRTKVKDWPKLIEHMAANGTLADVVAPLQTAGRTAPPEARITPLPSLTGCDEHPNGAVDPLPDPGWGECLLCNTRRRRANPSRRTA